MADDERPERAAPTEGVRILGAQEAAAIDAERRRAAGADDDLQIDVDAPDDQPRRADEPAPSLRHWPDEGPSWSAADTDEPAGQNEPAGPTGGARAGGVAADDTELPHWSEPATGQVPAVFADTTDPADEDDLDAWSAFTGPAPRYRAEGSDWAEADFTEALAGEPGDERLGALAEPEPDVADDDDAFVEAVRRRRSGTRRVVTSTPTPREPVRSRGGRPPRAATGRAGATSTAAARPGDMLPAPGRDLNLAIATAVIVAAIALVLFAFGRGPTSFLAAAVVGMASLELCNALHDKGLRPATIPVVAGCTAMPLAAYWFGDNLGGLSAFPVVLTLVTITTMLAFLWKFTPGRPVMGVATSMLVFTYVGGLGGYAGLMLQSIDGVGIVIGTAICVIAYDVVGYFVGSQFGHSLIAPDVSPNKTVEGTLAGIGASILASIIVLPQFAPWTGTRLVTLAIYVGFLIGIAALVGDLCESLLKRDLGVKDLGSFLPGHGGFLDRFDGLLFALPVAYYVALQLFG